MAKSILLREGQGTARYRLLDTIREFGLAKLSGRGNERRSGCGTGPFAALAAPDRHHGGAVARHAGARHVVVTDISEYRLELARKHRRQQAVNPPNENCRR